MQESNLVTIVEQSGLENSKAQTIMDSFNNFFEEAKKWELKAKAITVTDIAQVDLMKKAREVRLALKDIRVNAENTRKELKEQSLREGKAIDGIANVIKALIVPMEEHLEKQEKFAELKLARELDERNSKRVEALMPYVLDVTIYNLREMDNNSFERLLKSSKEAYEAQKKAEEEAEQERIEKEKKDKIEQEKIRKENLRLKEEARAREEQIQKERQAEQEKQRKIDEERRQKDEQDRIEKQKLEDQLKQQAIKISIDNEMYVVTWRNESSAVEGIGNTIEEAITDFCNNWLKK